MTVRVQYMCIYSTVRVLSTVQNTDDIYWYCSTGTVDLSQPTKNRASKMMAILNLLPQNQQSF